MTTFNEDFKKAMDAAAQDSDLSAPLISESMAKALVKMREMGFLYAGGGRWVNLKLGLARSTTIRGLASRGWAELKMSPDGGLMGKITHAGRETQFRIKTS